MKTDYVRTELDDLFVRIRAELSARRRDNVEITIRERRERLYSTIVFFDARDGQATQKLVLKKLVRVARVGPVGAVDAEAEFDALKVLHPRYAGVDGCSVPRPVLSLPEFDALIMEAYDAPVVQNQCGAMKRFASRRAFEALRRRLYLAGLWLRHFQSSGLARSGKAEGVSTFLEDCSARLRKLQGSRSRLIPEDFQDRVASQLEGLREATRGEEVPMRASHGDFGPWNLLATADGITVIDFSTCGEAPVCLDPLHMLVVLRDQYQNPFHSKRRVAEVERSFSDGYGERPKTPAAVSAVCEIRERLVRLCGAIFSDSDWRRGFERRAVANAHIGWLLDQRNREYLW